MVEKITDATVGPNQFRCDDCGGVFDFEWTDEEARAEQKANGFGNVPDSLMGIVCDDCYQAIM